MQTADDRFRKLAQLFPNAVTEALNADGKTVRAVDVSVLRQEISAEFLDGPEERYVFTWPGKRRALWLANMPTQCTLRPVISRSAGRDGTTGKWDSQNIYIEGDNLEALKILQETYLHKVKMIYIDPPYNTGNDFIYADDFSQGRQDYEAVSGSFDGEGNRLFRNTESNGRFHTDWLNMIFPRLRWCRNLLTDDGVIFISIDDNEAHNLRKVCDEIFGAYNFVAQLVWEKKYTVANDAKYFSDNHEYILCYAKDITHFTIGRLERSDDMNKAYKNPDNDPRGVWKATPLHAKSGSPSGATFSYTFSNGVVFTPPRGTYSRYSAETLRKMDEGGEIWFGRDGKSIPARKTFLCDLKKEGVVPRTLILHDVGGHNHEAVEELKHLIPENVFTNPKPTKLLRHLITIANTKDSDIILDFFSGSATTAHAVMALNAEDSGHRRFILVQLPEPVPPESEAHKAGYADICAIGEERIRRAGKKLREEFPAVSGGTDTGFRVFRVDSSNMKDVYRTPGELRQEELMDFAENIKEDRTPEDLLVQCMLEMGVELSAPVEERVIDGRRVFSVDGGYMTACFDAGITVRTVEAIAREKPYIAVFRDSCMENDSVITNFEQIFSAYSPNTRRRII